MGYWLGARPESTVFLRDAMKSQVPDSESERNMIGIGGGLTAPPSHTTGHTGPYHGGSDELSVRSDGHSGKTERVEIGIGQRLLDRRVP